GYEGWAVINKEIMQSLKVASFIDRMEKLEIGDQLLTSQKQWKKISALQRITDREVNTMNIKRIDKFNNFFAGGILASTYEK
ncbi:hypothetical protein KJ912_00890, partial [Patescibacteria group bacterium]|nr:hypothetical protein [Patescibacteria group bacterium]